MDAATMLVVPAAEVTMRVKEEPMDERGQELGELRFQDMSDPLCPDRSFASRPQVFGYDPLVVSGLPHPLPLARRVKSPDLLGYDDQLRPMFKSRTRGRQARDGGDANASASANAVRMSRVGRRCCVPGCQVRPDRDGKRAFHFPQASDDPDRHRQWVDVIGSRRRLPLGGAPFRPFHHHRVCEDHFFLGQPNPTRGHPDFVPSIFPWNDLRRPDGKEEWGRFHREADRAVQSEDPVTTSAVKVEKVEQQEEGENCSGGWGAALEDRGDGAGGPLPVCCGDVGCQENVKELRSKLAEASRKIDRWKRAFNSERRRRLLIQREMQKLKNSGRHKSKSSTATPGSSAAGNKKKRPVVLSKLKPVDLSQVPKHIRLKVEEKTRKLVH